MALKRFLFVLFFGLIIWGGYLFSVRIKSVQFFHYDQKVVISDGLKITVRPINLIQGAPMTFLIDLVSYEDSFFLNLSLEDIVFLLDDQGVDYDLLESEELQRDEYHVSYRLIFSDLRPLVPVKRLSFSFFEFSEHVFEWDLQ